MEGEGITVICWAARDATKCPECQGHLPTTNNYSAQNINLAKGKKAKY